MTTQMRALLLRQDGYADKIGYAGDTLAQPGDHIALGQIARPVPGPGQILIKMRRAAVNPSDIAFVQGYYGQARVAGQPAGFEGVGKVVEAGPGLMGKFLMGKDVAFYATPDGSGTWAEYAVTQTTLALPLKKGVADRDAAGLVVNPVTAAAMLDLVRPGEAFVFSAAASQLGKLTASLARDQRKKMIALVRRDAPVAALNALGAAHVLNETADSFEQDLAAVLRAEKPTIFLDAVAGETSAMVHAAMGRNARWVIYGKLDTAAATIHDPSAMIFQNKSIVGFWTTAWANKTPFMRKLRVFGEVQNRFRDGRWTTDIAAELPLEHAIERLPQALAQPDGKVQIILSEQN